MPDNNIEERKRLEQRREIIKLDWFEDKGCVVTESFLEKAGFKNANLRDEVNNLETVMKNIERLKGEFLGSSEVYIKEIVQEDGLSKYIFYYRVGPELVRDSKLITYLRNNKI